MAKGPEPLRQELAVFLDAVAGRRSPAVDVQAGIRAMRVVEAARLSSGIGRQVALEEVG